MPKHVDSNLIDLSKKLQTAKDALEALNSRLFEFNSVGFAEREQTIIDLSRDIAAYSMALQMQSAVLEASVDEIVSNLSGKYRMVCWRPYSISLVSGHTITIFMPYFARKCALGKGIYPHAVLLGLISGATPLLASLVAKYASALSSFREAKTMLGELGVKMSEKLIKKLTISFVRLAELGRLIEVESGEESKIEGVIKRLLISTDGGRVRIRKRKRGRKTKKGRDRYCAEWKEPKLIIIMAIGDDGRPHANIPPIIDATMGGPDVAFELIAQNLKSLDLTQAEPVFVADGARWIWDRVNSLLTKLGLEGKCKCLVDFYHVCNHLETIASNIKGWSDKEKRRWLRKMRKWLRSGKEVEVVSEIEEMTKWTKNKELKRERNYFKRHLENLSYNEAKKAGLPMGSGAVESAIRRVINLKLKGPSIIWDIETVEQMLTLRSYFKSGRWYQLESWAIKGCMHEHS